MGETRVLLDRNYTYLPDYNIVVNSEVLGLFSKYSGHIHKIRVSPVALSEHALLHELTKIDTLTLELTQNCNMRCVYCLFGGSYKFNRTRTRLHMDRSVAEAGLSMIKGIIENRQKKEFTIGFYGGEPLLRFSTLKSIVKSSARLFPGWKLHYALTTNGTLLNDEIIDFIINHKFEVVISLDGPKNIHDAKRVLPGKKGSFDRILKNLQSIKDKDPEFFRSIHLSLVWSPDLSIQEIYDFFSNEDNILNHNLIYLTRPACKDTEYYKKFPFDKEKLDQEVENVMKVIYGKIQAQVPLKPIDKVMMSNEIWSVLGRRDFSALYNACAFNDKLFLDCSGSFHICHQMNPKFPIGDVVHGLNLERMLAITREYHELLERYCRRCDVRFLCMRCYPNFAGDGRFEVDERRCALLRESILNALRKHLLQRENKVIEELLYG